MIAYAVIDVRRCKVLISVTCLKLDPNRVELSLNALLRVNGKSKLIVSYVSSMGLVA